MILGPKDLGFEDQPSRGSVCPHLYPFGFDTSVLYHPHLNFGSGDRPDSAQLDVFKCAKASTTAVQTHCEKALKNFEKSLRNVNQSPAGGCDDQPAGLVFAALAFAALAFPVATQWSTHARIS